MPCTYPNSGRSNKSRVPWIQAAPSLGKVTIAFREAVRIIKDELSNHTGRALLTMSTEKASADLQAKYREQFLDTKDVL